jgi:hypothetical protein
VSHDDGPEDLMASPSKAWFVVPVGEPDPRDSRPLRFPSVFAFVANGALLVLELIAGRVIAPTVGVSLYTWTAVIGVVLAGISLGSWIGGNLADRRPGRSILSLEFAGAALASALILVFDSNLESVSASFSWPTIWQVVWLATIIFFLPSVLIGMVTPMIVKLSLSSLETTGRVVGRIRAAAEVGAIVGVFLTGFVLIDAFGTRTIIVTVALTLAVLAILSSPLWVVAWGRLRRASATGD